MNINFNDYRNLLYKLANSIHRTTGVDADDLFSEGCVAFARIMKGYNPAMNVCFSTFLTIAARQHMIKYAKREQRHTHQDRVTPFMKEEKPSPCRYARFTAMLEQLGDEAKTVVDILLSTPQEILGEICCSVENDTDAGKLARKNWDGGWGVRNALRRHLKKEGWSGNKIKTTFNEISSALQGV